jgi:hypothetical protein
LAQEFDAARSALRQTGRAESDPEHAGGTERVGDHELLTGKRFRLVLRAER